MANTETIERTSPGKQEHYSPYVGYILLVFKDWVNFQNEFRYNLLDLLSLCWVPMHLSARFPRC